MGGMASSLNVGLKIGKTSHLLSLLYLQKTGKDNPTEALRETRKQRSFSFPAACSTGDGKLLLSSAELTPLLAEPLGERHCHSTTLRCGSASRSLHLHTASPPAPDCERLLDLLWAKASSKAGHLPPVQGTLGLLMSLQHHPLRDFSPKAHEQLGSYAAFTWRGGKPSGLSLCFKDLNFSHPKGPTNWLQTTCSVAIPQCFPLVSVDTALIFILPHRHIHMHTLFKIIFLKGVTRPIEVSVLLVGETRV